MNLNEALAVFGLVCFFGLLAAGFFLHSRPLGDWTKVLRWNVPGLFEAIRRRRYK